LLIFSNSDRDRDRRDLYIRGRAGRGAADRRAAKFNRNNDQQKMTKRGPIAKAKSGQF
jgi:hypothetical protein